MKIIQKTITTATYVALMAPFTVMAQIPTPTANTFTPPGSASEDDPLSIIGHGFADGTTLGGGAIMGVGTLACVAGIIYKFVEWNRDRATALQLGASAFGGVLGIFLSVWAGGEVIGIWG